MTKSKVLFLTQRGLQQQQWALEGAPAELEIMMRREPSKEEVLELLPEMDFLITERSGTIDADMVAAGKKLRLIQRLGIQTWDLDLDAARKANIPVCYKPVPGCVMVAEHIVMQILGMFKKTREMMQVVAEAKDWGRPPRKGDEDTFDYNWSGRGGIAGMQGKTIGILGMGEIGLELAWRVMPFGTRVLYNKRRRFPAEAEEKFRVQYATQAEIEAQSDVVVSLLPYLGPVYPLDAAFFGRMKTGAYFSHCGSGGVVDEDALIAAYKSGHLAGFAIDGFNWEPFRSDDPLLELARDPLANVVLSPHVAAGGIVATEISRAARAADYDNLMALLSGGELMYRLV